MLGLVALLALLASGLLKMLDMDDFGDRLLLFALSCALLGPIIDRLGAELLTPPQGFPRTLSALMAGGVVGLGYLRFRRHRDLLQKQQGSGPAMSLKQRLEDER